MAGPVRVGILLPLVWVPMGVGSMDPGIDDRSAIATAPSTRGSAASAEARVDPAGQVDR